MQKTLHYNSWIIQLINDTYIATHTQFLTASNLEKLQNCIDELNEKCGNSQCYSASCMKRKLVKNSENDVPTANN
jgi:hypothetical protein